MERRQVRYQAVVTGVAAVLLLGGAAAHGAEEPKPDKAKIGYVDLGVVFDSYERTKNSESSLEQRGKQKEQELEGRINELKKMREGLELLNDDAREAKAREVEERAESLQQFRNSAARDLRRERDKVAKGILDDIQSAIQEYGKANGFSLVLDARSLLYAEQAHDITDEVVKLLNSRAKTAAPKKSE